MQKKARVYISRMIPEKPLKMLEDFAEVHIWEGETPPPRAKLLDELALADGAIVMLTEKINQEALDAAPKLRVLSNYAVGYDNIDIDAATARGIPIGNTPGVLTETTADQAFALLLAAARRVVEGVDYVKAGQWQSWNPIQLLGYEVNGATLGIIGLGRIGYAMAKRAQGFGMRLLYHGGSNREYAAKVGATAVDLESLLRESDFISIHCPLNENTRGMIGAKEFAMMKASAILINTARGAIIQNDALLEALQTGKIAGAALDVTEPEPIAANHPLVLEPRCLVVPHLGSATWKTRERMGILAAENLIAGLKGEKLPHIVNPKVYRS